MKYEITRAYSRTIQLEPFTPSSIFMSAKAEMEENSTDKDIKDFSNSLYKLCKETVDNDIEKLKNEKERTKKIVEELS